MIHLENLSYRYSNDNSMILRNINLNIQEGEIISIMGPSGSGKSTLLNIIGFMDKGYEGEYSFKGVSSKKLSDNKLSRIRNEYIGFIFQNFKLIKNLSVYENVKLPILYSKNSDTNIKNIDKVIELVGLGEKKFENVSNLSGGQQQRVAIARSLVNNPKFIIADEPTGALDRKNSIAIMNLFQNINSDFDTSIIVVTHDRSIAEMTNKIIHFNDGEIERIEYLT